MKTGETVFLRTYSDLGEYQRKYLLEYSLITDASCEKAFGLQVRALDAQNRVTGQCVFCAVTESKEKIMQLIQYLYENGITPSCTQGVLQDLFPARSLF